MTEFPRRAPGSPASLSARKKRIAANFGRAARYDKLATAQAASGSELAKLIASEAIAPEASCLELGCGSGLFSRELLKLDLASYVLSDISLGMLSRCRANLGVLPKVSYVLCDAEDPAFKPGFELVAANLALQWVSGLSECLRRLYALLAPGGRLAISLPGVETFSEWRLACSDLGLACGLIDFPTREDLAQALPLAKGGVVCERAFPVTHAKAISFPRYLKALGANQASREHTPLNAASFRRLLRLLENKGRGGVTMTYQVYFAIYQKDA